MTRQLVAVGAVAVCVLGAFFVFADDKKAAQDGEREVKQDEVPASALAALKKVAGAAGLTGFAEETEHGRKFYEGSFKGPDGNVDILVTESGDLVAIEESIPATKVPHAVRTAAEKEAGEDATFERKTFYVYEIHFTKDGKNRELIFTTDARPYQEGQAK